MADKIISADELSVDISEGDVLVNFRELPEITVRFSPSEAREIADTLMIKANRAEGRAPLAQ